MKLKLVVVSMSVLGLVSSPLFAATTTTATTKHHKKHHHTVSVKHHTTRHVEVKRHTVKHHEVKRHEIKHREVRRHEIKVHEVKVHEIKHHEVKRMESYREQERREARLEAEEAQANYKGEIPTVCTVNSSELILASATQNIGRALPNPCNPGWYNRVHLSGGVNADLGKWGNRDGNIEGENYQRVSLNDAYLNITGNITGWVNAFASLSYSNPTSNNRGASSHGPTSGSDPSSDPSSNSSSGTSSSSWSSSSRSWGYSYSDVYQTGKISLEQAYFTIGNFDQSPFYLQAGKEFLDFGRYQIHPITVPLTQVMSETLATTLKLGVILDSGFNASIYAFNDALNKTYDGEHPPYNYGFAVGYTQANDNFGFDLGGGYMHNIISAGDIAHAVSKFSMDDCRYHSRVGGLALYGDVNAGPFVFNARWVSTIQRFNNMDLPRDGWADFNDMTRMVYPDASGAKPWALTLEAGYGFSEFNKDNTIYVGYQTSRESAGIGLPKYRYLAGWDVEVFKYTNIGIEWDHDREYSYNQGGRNNITDLFSIRTAVRFN